MSQKRNRNKSANREQKDWAYIHSDALIRANRTLEKTPESIAILLAGEDNRSLRFDVANPKQVEDAYLSVQGQAMTTFGRKLPIREIVSVVFGLFYDEDYYGDQMIRQRLATAVMAYLHETKSWETLKQLKLTGIIVIAETLPDGRHLRPGQISDYDFVDGYAREHYPNKE